MDEAAYFNLSENGKRAYLQKAISKIVKLKSASLTENKKTPFNANFPVVTCNKKDRHKPFPLTDIQEAYLVGREINSGEKKIGCHIYAEIFPKEVDIRKMNNAWNKLVETNDMLRAIITKNDGQRVMEHAPEYDFEVLEASDSKRFWELHRHLRKRMSHKCHETDRWPLFEIKVLKDTSINDAYKNEKLEKAIFFLSIDAMIVDGTSILNILRSWYSLYNVPDLEIALPEETFRDYVIAKIAYEKTASYEKERTYWLDKCAHLPPGPKLPLIPALDQKQDVQRKRLTGTLPRAYLKQLQLMAKELNISLSSLLLTIFAKVISSRSTSDRYSLIVTYYNRLPIIKKIESIIGPFMSTSIFIVDQTTGGSLDRQAKRFHKQLLQDLDNPNFSGVKVLRELRRKKKIDSSMALPIVFTSMIKDVETQNEPEGTWYNDIIYAVTQTPQIYLDHQVMINDGGHLIFTWDIVEGLFEPDYLKNMFGDYCYCLRMYASGRRGTGKKPFPLLVDQNRKGDSLSDDQNLPFQQTELQKAYLFYRQYPAVKRNSENIAYQEYDLKSLDISRLKTAINTLMRTHEILRVKIRNDGTQAIAREVPEYDPGVADLRDVAEDKKRSALSSIREKMVETKFDMDQPPLFKAGVTIIADDHYRLHLAVDMIMMDGNSFQLFCSQLFYLCNKEDTLLKPGITFHDYMRFVEDFRRTDAYNGSFEYWAQKLTALPLGPELPFVKTDSGHGTQYERLEHRLANWDIIQKRADETAVPPSALLLAALNEVMAYFCNRKPFTVLAVDFSRMKIHPDINGVIGDFTNLCWIIDDGMKSFFSEKVKKIHVEMQADLDNRPISGLAAIQTFNQTLRNKIETFPVVFTNLPQSSARTYQHAERGWGISKTSNVAVDVLVFDFQGSLHICWDVEKSNFPAGYVERMFAAYIKLVELLNTNDAVWDREDYGDMIEVGDKLNDKKTTENAVVDNDTKNGEKDDLSRAERDKILYEWNNTKVAFDEQICIHELFEAQTEKTPENIATISDDSTLTYRTLNQRANQLGRYLRNEHEVKPETLIAVCLDRSHEMIISVLGILKAGGAYVPLETKYPAKRIQKIVKNGGIDYIISDSKYRQVMEGVDATVIYLDMESERIHTEYDDKNLTCINSSENTAYVIYTSGSTGDPKGVVITHKPVINLIEWAQKAFGFGSGDRGLFITPLSFDLSVFDIFGLLSYGCSLHIVPDNKRLDYDYLADVLLHKGITFWNSAPATLQILTPFLKRHRANRGYTALRLVYLSGDWIPLSLPPEIENIFSSARVISLGGATEATVWSNYYEIGKIKENWKSVPYGKPIQNAEYYIFDADMNVCPVGVPGDLYIGGVCLSKGYHNLPEITANSFVLNPYATGVDQKIYKTGDIARFFPDGNIEFLGRADNQVKIRGFRIELGEIEHRIKQHGKVKEAIVMVATDNADEKKLVACLKMASSGKVSLKELRAYTSETLPDYMLPNGIVIIDEFPVTNNGKVDRKALMESYRQQPAQSADMFVTIKKEPEGNPGDKNHMDCPEEKSSKLVGGIDNETGCRCADTLTVDKVKNIIEKLMPSGNIDIHADLFDIGATSLTIVNAARQIKTVLDIEFPLEQMLENPNIMAMAAYIDRVQVRNSGLDSDVPPRTQENNPCHTVEPCRETNRVVEIYEKTAERSEGYKIESEKFSGLLSLLKCKIIDKTEKYLYASAGGLYSIQAYLYIKKNSVQGVCEGFYYYHPVDHALIQLSRENNIDAGVFHEFYRDRFNTSDFCIFFICQMKAIEPIYSIASNALATLDAGYIIQLLLNHQNEYDLSLSPAEFLSFDEIKKAFFLDDGHRYIHCVVGRLKPGKAQDQNEMGTKHNLSAFVRNSKQMPNCELLKNDTWPVLQETEGSTRRGEFTILSESEHLAFHESKHNLRQISNNQTVVDLENRSMAANHYTKRSSIRKYIKSTIPHEKFRRFLSVLARKKTDHNGFRYPYYMQLLDDSIKLYVYIKENAVEELQSGIYRYDDVGDTLVLIRNQIENDIRLSHYPGNRGYYNDSGFSIYVIADLKMIKPLFHERSINLAMIVSGCIGQLLMEKQSPYDIGICPIGGMNFDRMRMDFNLDSDHMLLHSFVGGGFKHEKIDTPIEAGKEKNAIIGLGARLPGADTLDDFWNNLLSKSISITEISKERWFTDVENMAESGHRQPYANRAGLLKNVHCFDSLFFNISPFEANSMDPQERLFLEVVWECIENAGYTTDTLNASAKKIGVFIGVMWNDYQNMGLENWRCTDNASVASFFSSIAHRVSYYYNFTGPSIAVDTSCSSTITALHLANQSLKNKECDAAIVGGINVIAHPYHQQLLCDLDVLSKDNKSRAFNADSSGWVMGEGVGAILLRPVTTAIGERDHIYAAIKGTKIGHSGKTARYGMSSAKAKCGSIIETMAAAGVSADEIDYVEAASAGAAITDIQEINAIADAFRQRAEKKHRWRIGSVKPNIGHLESASGISQICKVLLQMRHKIIAPTLYEPQSTPSPELEDDTLRIVSEKTPWAQRLSATEDPVDKPMLSLVTSFGSTGSSGHVIIEKTIAAQRRTVGLGRGLVFIFSAGTPLQLNAYLKRFIRYFEVNRPLIEKESMPSYLRDMAYTLQIGRVEMEERVAVISDDLDGLITQIAAVVSGKDGHDDSVLRGNPKEQNADVLQTDKRDDLTQAAIGWVCGKAIDWARFHDEEDRKIPLPAHPFERIEHAIKISSHEPDSAPLEGNENKTIVENECAAFAPDANAFELAQTVEKFLKHVFAEESLIAVDTISGERNLWDYGLNSLLIQKLNARLEKSIGNISKTLFFEYQTLRDLSAYLVRRHGSEIKQLLGESITPDQPAIPQKLCVHENVRPNRLGHKDQRRIKTNHQKNDVAIIGLSGRYPMANDMDALWENLKNGRDCITEIPETRWDYRDYYGGASGGERKIDTKWGGYIDDVDAFDSIFFNIAPRDAKIMDPQERLFLETVWSTVEDAGYTRKSLRECFDGAVGVFASVMYGEYQFFGIEATLNGHPTACGSAYGSIANRVSYFFDFNGPSMAIDTMCSGALACLHMAVQSIHAGECGAAIVGGVNLSLHPNKYIGLKQWNMSSPTGRCSSFGKNADGFVPGEGVGAILIKSLEDAIKDNDHIYAVIKGTAMNHDGKTSNYTVPNPKNQAGLVKRALDKADIDPRSISYIEAHGTGTSLGDPIEIEGLTRAFRRHTDDRQFCPVGSIKANIGHLESAAGIAAITKVLLQLKHKHYVPSIHADTSNSNIDFDNTPFFIQKKYEKWERPIVRKNGNEIELPRRAGISAFGAGGTNVHVILEDYAGVEVAEMALAETGDTDLFLLSAANDDRLKAYAERLSAFIQNKFLAPHDIGFENKPETDRKRTLFYQIAHTLRTGRETMASRLAITASSIEELNRKLGDFCQRKFDTEGIIRGNARNEREFLNDIFGGPTGDALIDHILEAKDLRKLAALWVNGVDIDWRKLRRSPNPERISLPTYPFEKKRHWIVTQNNEAPKEKIEPEVTTIEEEILYCPQWIAAPVERIKGKTGIDGGESENTGETALIVYDEEQFRLKDLICAALRAESVLEIVPSDQTVMISENKWRVDVKDSCAFDICIKNLKKIDKVFFLAGSHLDNTDDPPDMSFLKKCQEKGLLSLFRLMKSLIKFGFGRDATEIRIVLHAVYPVFPGDKSNPLSAGLHGLAQSIAREYPKFRVQCVDINADPNSFSKTTPENDALVEDIISDFGDSSDNYIAIRNGKKYQRCLIPIHLNKSEKTKFKKDGVYLIVGGTGGIGIEISRHIADVTTAKIILIGRREPSKETQKQIREIQSRNSRVAYLRADVADLGSMVDAVKTIKSRFGGIDGVFHSAIVTQDSLLKNMDENALLNVLHPKVQGTVALFHALKEEHPDFVMLFSSAQSFCCSEGTGNYVAGCTFKDAFGLFWNRNRTFPVYVVNWGYWGKTGAGCKKHLNALFRSRGIQSISPMEGTSAVERILTDDIPQIVPFKAENDLLTRIGVDLTRQLDVYPVKIPSMIGKVRLKVEPVKEDLNRILNYRSLERYVAMILFDTFVKNNGISYSRNGIMMDDFIQDLQISPKYGRLVFALLEILEKSGLLMIDKNEIHITENALSNQIKDEIGNLERTRALLEEQLPETEPYIQILHLCIENYMDILTGKTLATDIMFPSGSMALMEKLYKDNSAADYYNRLMRSAVNAYIERRVGGTGPSGKISILEIGAGTGGTTEFILKHIKTYEPHVEYLYTDISQAFVAHGKREYQREYPFVDFKTFNLELDSEQQGFLPDSFDLIIAANVIHATRNIRDTLIKLKTLLKRNGWILINEMTAVQDLHTATFGLLDGWWAFEDADIRQKHSPLLDNNAWKTVLSEEGFRHAITVVDDVTGGKKAGQAIIVAESDGKILLENKSDAIKSQSSRPLDESEPVDPVELKNEAKAEEIVEDTKKGPICGNVEPLENAHRFIRKIVCDVLQIDDMEAFDPDLAFSDYGVDSILTGIIIKKINEKLDTKLKKTDLFRYSTLNSLVAFIVSTADAGRFQDMENAPEEIPTGKKEDAEPKTGNGETETDQRVQAVNNNNHPCDIEYVSCSEEADPSSRADDIAIIGISGRFPGAKNVTEYWHNLKNGKDAISEIPPSRWQVQSFYDSNPRSKNKSYCKWGGFLSDVDLFDPIFFNISPKEAEFMEPQQRLFLQESWRAIEDAGYAPLGLNGARCSVYVGCQHSDYNNDFLLNETNAYTASGISSSILPARLSYLLNLKGPSIPVDTACSGSLVALHLGCDSIRNGSCDLSLVGGVSIITSPLPYITLSKIGILSPDGKLRAFDRGANGFVPGEAVGAVLLKSHESARKDGDHIYALIKGSAINQDGKTNGITSPNAESQCELECEVYDTFGINPENIGYIETHGTGTKIGDQIELEALLETFRKHTSKEKFCAIGSVKTNVGHTASAAGITSLIKVICCLNNKQIPPSLNFREDNAHSILSKSPFFVNTSLEDWRSEGNKSRLAAVSSFGFSGTNCHAVLEEARPDPLSPSEKPALPFYLIPMSAKTQNALTQKINELLEWLGDEARHAHLGDIAYTLSVGRDHFPFRYAVVVQHRHELENELKSIQRRPVKNEMDSGGKVEKKRNPWDATISTAEIREIIDLPADRYYEELVRLADLYMQGNDLDWQAFWGRSKCRRIAMPTYPFGGERYWIEKKERPGAAETPAGKKGQARHPYQMKKQTLFSNADEYAFRCRGDSSVFLGSDHMINGEHIIPGTVQIEMACAAAKKAGFPKVRKIVNAVWLSPIKVSEMNNSLTIRLIPEKEFVAFEIGISGNDGWRRLFSQGKLDCNGKSLTTPAKQTVNMMELRDRCRATRSNVECYELFKKIGLQYGPRLRGISGLSCNETEVIADISLPPEELPDAGRFILNPILMDNALQSVLGLSINGDEASGGSGGYMPYCVETIDVLGRLENNCHAYVINTHVIRLPKVHMKKYDIIIFNASGREVCNIKNFTIIRRKKELIEIEKNDRDIRMIMNLVRTGELKAVEAINLMEVPC